MQHRLIAHGKDSLRSDKSDDRFIKDRRFIEDRVIEMCAGFRRKDQCDGKAKELLAAMYDFKLVNLLRSSAFKPPPEAAKGLLAVLLRYRDRKFPGLKTLRAAHLTTETRVDDPTITPPLTLRDLADKDTTTKQIIVDFNTHDWKGTEGVKVLTPRAAVSMFAWITQRIAYDLANDLLPLDKFKSDDSRAQESLAYRVAGAVPHMTNVGMQQDFVTNDARVAIALYAPFEGEYGELSRCIKAIRKKPKKTMVVSDRASDNTGLIERLNELVDTVVRNGDPSMTNEEGGAVRERDISLLRREKTVYAWTFMMMQDRDILKSHPHALHLTLAYYKFDTSATGFQTPKAELVRMMKTRFGREVDGVPRITCELKYATTCSVLPLSHVDDVMRMWSSRGIFSAIMTDDDVRPSFDPTPEDSASDDEEDVKEAWNWDSRCREQWLAIAKLEKQEGMLGRWNCARMARLANDCVKYASKAGYEKYYKERNEKYIEERTSEQELTQRRADAATHSLLIKHFAGYGSLELEDIAVRARVGAYMIGTSARNKRRRHASALELKYAARRKYSGEAGPWTEDDVAQYRQNTCIQPVVADVIDKAQENDIGITHVVASKVNARVVSADVDIAESIYASWNVTPAQRAVDLVVKWALLRTENNEGPSDNEKIIQDACIGQVFNKLRGLMRKECKMLVEHQGGLKEDTAWVHDQWEKLLTLFDAEGNALSYEENTYKDKITARRLGVVLGFALFEKEFRLKLLDLGAAARKEEAIAVAAAARAATREEASLEEAERLEIKRASEGEPLGILQEIALDSYIDDKYVLDDELDEKDDEPEEQNDEPEEQYDEDMVEEARNREMYEDRSDEDIVLSEAYDDAQVALDLSSDVNLEKDATGKYRYRLTQSYAAYKGNHRPVRETSDDESQKEQVAAAAAEQPDRVDGGARAYFDRFAKPVERDGMEHKILSLEGATRPGDDDGVIGLAPPVHETLLSFRGTQGDWSCLLEFELYLYQNIRNELAGEADPPGTEDESKLRVMSSHYKARSPLSVRDDDGSDPVWPFSEGSARDLDRTWYDARRDRINLRRLTVQQILIGSESAGTKALQARRATANTMLMSWGIFHKFVKWQKNMLHRSDTTELRNGDPVTAAFGGTDDASSWFKGTIVGVHERVGAGESLYDVKYDDDDDTDSHLLRRFVNAQTNSSSSSDSESEDEHAGAS